MVSAMPAAEITSIAGVSAWAYFTIFICDTTSPRGQRGEALGLALLQAEGAHLAAAARFSEELAGPPSWPAHLRRV
jgi:hypothetical protein